MIDNLASKDALVQGGHILKTDRENLVAAEKKIAELELKIRNSETANAAIHAENEKLKWQCAQLRIGVTAMGEHFNCPPEEFKKIYDAYCAKQEEEYQKMANEAKDKFREDLKAGKVPDLRANGGEPKLGVIDGGKDA